MRSRQPSFVKRGWLSVTIWWLRTAWLSNASVAVIAMILDGVGYKTARSAIAASAQWALPLALLA
jgi:hypothetical protein